MAYTVPKSFDEFQTNIALTATQQQEVRDKKASATAAVKRGFPASSNMPTTAQKLIGSAARSTIIRPLDDIDMLAVFDHTLVWPTYQYDSQAFLYRVRDALKSETTVRLVGSKGQAVRLQYATGAHVDLTPAFNRDGGGYLIPKGDGGWLSTDPDQHAEFMAARNQTLSSRLKPLVRMLKRWNRSHSSRLKSFHLEVMAQSGVSYLASNEAERVEDFFTNAEYRLDVADPAGLSGTFTSTWSWDKRQAVITSLRSARDRAAKAREYERNGQIAAAIGQWQIIFGKDIFPAYG
jgi:hypothetical protein